MIKRVGLVAMSFVLATSSLLVLQPAAKVSGAISACSVSMTPHKVNVGSNTTYSFELTNNDPDTIQWIRIARPTSQFALSSARATGWSASLSADNAIFRWGGLDQGDKLLITINASVDPSVNGTFSWSLFGTDDPDGANQFACSGDLSVTVGDPPPPPVSISNLAVTGVSENSAVVKWTTNIPTKSQVFYGTTDQFGRDTGISDAYATSHNIRISGLNPATVYHYKVTNQSEAGASASSMNSTFKTANHQVEEEIIEELTLNPVGNTTETVPPTISFTSDISGAYKETPAFRGVASDNAAIATLEYSIDGGDNWIPVDKVERTLTYLRGKRVVKDKELIFEFTPLNLEDGDFIVMARATDTSRNRGYTAPVRLVIDRLPPQVGGSMISIGPHVLASQTQGTISSVAGVEQKITMSAIGGPTEIILTATVKDNPRLKKTVSLSQDKASGLWSGSLYFDHPATYELESKAIDGAGNITSRGLETIDVAPSASVVTKDSNQPLSGASVELYYFVPRTESWALWDGEAYGQPNPQLTNDQGRFSFFLPPGKYYLEVKKPGFSSVYTRMFNLEEPLPISSAISMSNGIGLTIASRPYYLPTWSTIALDIKKRIAPVNIASQNPESLTGKQLPDFNLPDNQGGVVLARDLLGKPTLISFVATWSPAAKSQLPILSKIQTNTDINVAPIVVHESTGKVNSYLNLAGYKLRVAIDKSGAAIPAFAVRGMPLHVFVDANGFVKMVTVGVLSEQDIKKGMGD